MPAWCGWRNCSSGTISLPLIPTLRFTGNKGAYYETYVAQNLLGILAARWPAAGLYFWNIQGRVEVDLVIETRNSCLALEVKTSPRWTDRDLNGLKSFLFFTPHCRMRILAYNGNEMVKLGDRLWAIPLSAVLS